jgi:hypothetical protein
MVIHNWLELEISFFSVFHPQEEKRKWLGDRRPPRIGDLGLPAHPPGGATTVAVQSRVMSSRSSPGVCSPPAGGTLPSPTPLLLVSLFLSVMQVHSCFLSWPTLDFFLLLLLAFLFVDLGYNYYSCYAVVCC